MIADIPEVDLFQSSLLDPYDFSKPFYFNADSSVFETFGPEK